MGRQACCGLKKPVASATAMIKLLLALLVIALFAFSAEGLKCYQDHGNWTQATARGKPEPCSGGAFCRAVTIKSRESAKSIHLYDCAVTCKSVTDAKTVPKNITGALAVRTSVTCCTTDGCNQHGPRVKIQSGALTRYAPSLLLAMAVAWAALAAQ